MKGYGGRAVIKPSKPSGGSARARLSGLHARFGLLGGMTLLLRLGSVQPSSPISCSGSVCTTEPSCSAEHTRFDSRPVWRATEGYRGVQRGVVGVEVVNSLTRSGMHLVMVFVV